MSFNIFINKRKCFIVILLAMIIFGFIKSDFVLAATKPVLYVNGSKSAAKPILVNQLAMLPLRDTFSILGCDNINWDPKTSTVTAITGDLTLTMQVGNKTAYTSLSGNFKVEEELMQTPILQDNKVYLPLRFVAETFKINIAYKGGRIDMITPFMYKDQQWYVNGSMGTSYDKNPQKWELIKIDNLNVLQKGDLIYYRLPFLVSGTVTYLESYLYALDKQGRAKLLFHFPGELHNYKIVEETLYYQTNTSFTSVWANMKLARQN